MDPNKMKDITQEEVSKLTKAMKDKEFQSHMEEYCKEISDPAHRKEYLQYLDQLEAKGEMPEGQVLLRTEPGCCVKTSIAFKNGQVQKCFVNIVHSELIDDMSELPDENGGTGKRVHLPYSLGPPRTERDNKNEMCMTADFAVSTWTFGQAIQRPQILKMIVDTASDGLQRQFLKGHEEVKKDFKVMRRIKCRGPGARPLPMSVKGELLKNKGQSKRPVMSSVAAKDSVTPSELREMRKEAKEKQLKPSPSNDDEEVPTKPLESPEPATTASGAPRIRVPKHKLIHSGVYDLTDFMEASNRPTSLAQSIPRMLKLVVELPSVKKSSDVSLDVTSTNICIEVIDKYYLDLPLSYEIDEKNGSAKFDKVAQTLTLELPVVPKPPDPNLLANRHGFESEGEAEDDDHEDDDEETVDDRGKEEVEDRDLPPLEDPHDTHSPELPSPEQEPPAPQPLAPATSSQLPSRPAIQPTAPSDLVPEDELPAFVASESFGGARQGYYFGLGDDGLGYYRDMRQRRPARQAPAEPTQAVAEVRLTPEASSSTADIGDGAPLVEEIDSEEFIPASASTQTPEPRVALPRKVQEYLGASELLTSRIAAADIDKSAGPMEPSLDWHQTRQNLILLIGIPAGHEIAGLQLSILGRRLTISFCTRLTGTEAWCQQRIRRMLCRGVDARQWHADLPSPLIQDSIEEAQLAVVLRKSEQGDKWLEAFDASAATDTWEPAMESIEAAESVATDATQHATAAGDSAAGTNAEIAPEVAEDSAELDIAAPAAHDTANKDAGSAKLAPPAPFNASIASAAAQSAMVMGQAVLLRTRLMYELF